MVAVWSVRMGLKQIKYIVSYYRQYCTYINLRVLQLILCVHFFFKFISAVVQLRVGTLATSKDPTSFPLPSATILHVPVPGSTAPHEPSAFEAMHSDRAQISSFAKAKRITDLFCLSLVD